MTCFAGPASPAASCTCFLAHHQEDQAETLLLRLGRGSGLEGLAAMAPVTEVAKLRLLRPLLTVPKQRLVDFLKTHDCDWIEDPSNLDPNHARVRLRRLHARSQPGRG